MKLRLYAGTINARPDEEGWRNFTLDISARGVWDRDLRISVLPDFVADISNLIDLRDEMFDELVLHHVLEHLHLDAARLALAEAFRILKPGGCLDIETPDAFEVARRWGAGEITGEEYQQWTYGEQLSKHEMGDSHRYGWSADSLEEAVAEAGFEDLERIPAGLACRFRGLKPGEQE